MLSVTQRDKIRSAFSSGTLRVRSVAPSGDVEWKRVLAVHRHDIGPESVWEATTERGPMVLTGGHRVFTSPTHKTEMEGLKKGDTVLGVETQTEMSTRPVLLSVRKTDNRTFMYDLTAEGWHNFLLHRSGVVVSNSPDRNYRFRPPEGEGEVGCFNQVFGYIWTDEELLEFLKIALDKWNMHPPSTEELSSIEILCQRKPSWRAALLWGALVNAAQALAYNWVADEFSYSIGGISLDIEKSSKYMDLKQNAEDQWDKLTEAKSRTTKYMAGLRQPRFGRGVRSAFGPHVGRGVLSPRNFV